MSNSDLTAKVDPLIGSIDHLLGVSFTKSSSTVYPLVAQLAKAASQYSEGKIGNSLHHFAIFNKTREDAARALALVELARGWKSLQVFVQGRLIDIHWEPRSVLSCYSKALACDDTTAHCHRIIDDPSSQSQQNRNTISIRLDINQSGGNEPSPDRYVFPCAFIEGNFSFVLDHPAGLRNQIQAKGVESGCDWCPLFNPDSFRKLPKTQPDQK